ncbi:MAG: (deoxy)nucleoside triphosphate pyrophosphohydrolase [Erysipelotrichaceae bacterium]|nr:(deoxy)nucleoside triphosphate pyrophosphohydrolase [Erysipelotrichaceae bacterium]
MKVVNVVAAIIKKDEKIFATQRGYGNLKGGWEFPGGKIEKGETPQQALAREIMEELNITIVVEDFLTKIEYDYPTFHLSMECYFASIKSGSIELKEHSSAKWLSKQELDTVEWLPADITIIDLLKGKL